MEAQEEIAVGALHHGEILDGGELATVPKVLSLGGRPESYAFATRESIEKDYGFRRRSRSRWSSSAGGEGEQDQKAHYSRVDLLVDARNPLPVSLSRARPTRP